MASSEDEVDYMSEDFVRSCVQDVRPGLVFSRTTKRKYEVEHKQKASNHRAMEINKPIKALEAEKREEGLNAMITAENKGFAMLKKMGYAPGKGLGKQKEGITEPIPVIIKSDRGGLGRESALKEIEEKKAVIRARKLNSHSQMNVDEFRQRMKNQANQKLDLADLRRSQRVCHELDMKKGILEPAESWFWPEEKDHSEKTEEEEKIQEQEETKNKKIRSEIDQEQEDSEPCIYETHEQLELITSYLKNAHLYCIWCGTMFEDVEDISSNCPGSRREDH